MTDKNKEPSLYSYRGGGMEGEKDGAFGKLPGVRASRSLNQVVLSQHGAGDYSYPFRYDGCKECVFSFPLSFPEKQQISHRDPNEVKKYLLSQLHSENK